MDTRKLLVTINTLIGRLTRALPERFDLVLWGCMQTVGHALNVDRMYIWQNYTEGGELYCKQVYEWSEGAEPQQGKDFTLAMPYSEVPYWRDTLLSGKAINAYVKDLPEEERTVLDPQGVLSILVIPVFLETGLWGFIGFDDCHTLRTFSEMDEEALRSGGNLMVSAILRNETTLKQLRLQNELMEHDRLSQAVNAVAALLIGEESTREDQQASLASALGILGRSIEADRVYMWKNTKVDDVLYSSRLADWTEDDSLPVRPSPASVPFDQLFKGRGEQLCNNDYVVLTPDDLRHSRTLFPEMADVLSALIIPIFFRGQFWGFIGFEDNTSRHDFSPLQAEVLRSGGLLLAASVLRSEMTEGLIKAREDALASANAKSEFLSRMSHEIRTPMNAIIGMTSIAKKSSSLEQVKGCLNQIEASSHQLLGLINDVLDMSKIEANRLTINNEEFDFDEMVLSVIAMMQVKIDERRLEFSYEDACSFTRKVFSDELRLSQVLINLLSNAAKFTPEGGHITLQVSLGPHEAGQADEAKHRILKVAVIDDGIGISQDKQKQLFTSFEQLDGGVTRQYGGTGLGLAISKSIVELMDGRIWVESEEGKGSSFFFEVPITLGVAELSHGSEDATEGAGPAGQDVSGRQGVAADAAAGTSSASQKEIPSQEHDWSEKTILLVDDIEINREIIITVLEGTGIHIVSAQNGQEAVDRFRSNPQGFDLILMDIQMPLMDGMQATRTIRRLDCDEASGIPIIAMTANAFREDVQRSLEAGMNDHLAKPLEVETFFDLLADYFDA